MRGQTLFLLLLTTMTLQVSGVFLLLALLPRDMSQSWISRFLFCVVVVGSWTAGVCVAWRFKDRS